MRFFTKEWYQANQGPNGCGDDSTWTRYELHLKEQEIPETLRTFSAHDSLIKRCEWVGDELHLHFDTIGALSDLERAVFHNATLSCECAKLIDSYWLYEEIERCDEGWKLCALLSRRDTLLEIEIRFSEMEG